MRNARPIQKMVPMPRCQRGAERMGGPVVAPEDCRLREHRQHDRKHDIDGDGLQVWPVGC